ncbi:DUF5343 domain-containing protein [Bradyrhizobium tunisiense]|uniref:DUF5343 domain-containing protein n=1 Tax=Bradyrhizobium tunisiense TaxID=3278709 RepID=UPI0035DEA99D
MPVTPDKPAPYAPGKTILDIIDRYRHRGLPVPVTGEVLGRAGIPDSLHARTMQALATLDLIDAEGRPTPTLEGIRLAPEAEYKKRLEDWLKGTYADVFSFVDPTTDDETRIRDAFRNYQPIGQQPRMVILFQALCEAAGLIASKPDTTRAPRPRGAPAIPAKRAAIPKPTHFAGGGTIGAASGTLPPALTGLLASIPTNGNGWTQQQRDKFMTTFGTVLDFCIPVVERDRAEADQEAQL